MHVIADINASRPVRAEAAREPPSKLDTAIDRARQQPEGALLRLVTPCGPLDAARLVDTLPNDSDWLTWFDGRREAFFAAVGRLTELRLPTAESWQPVAEFYSRVCKQCSSSELPLPLIVGGVAFDPQRMGSDPVWAGWPAVHFWVPAHVAGVWRSADGSLQGGIVSHVAIAANAERDRVAHAVRRARDQAASWLAASAPDHTDASRHPAAAQSNESHDAWCRRVAAARDAVGADAGVDTPSDLRKVVLARSAHFTAPAGQRFDAAATLTRLRRRYPRAFCFALRQGNSRFVGASPELLVESHGRELHSEALAGTAARGATPEADAALAAALLDSAKERHEHQLVVDSIVAALRRTGHRVAHASAPEVIRLANVQHLHTAVHAELPRAGSLLDAAGALHPTPAVGGMPREAARRYLFEHESLARGWYTGTVGWLGPTGDGCFTVAIRSALLRGSDAWAYTGAGIVTGSDPESEWRETELKLRAIGEALVSRQESTP